MAQTKIINVDTSKAQQSVKELENQVENLNKDLQNTQKEIQDLKDIPKTTNTAFKGLQSSVENTKFNITELTKAVNTAKFDIGVFGESVSKIGAGVAGGFNIVSGAIKFMGLESDETSKAITELQFFLQQLPLQFFAIAEGIQSATNVWNSFKSVIKVDDLTAITKMKEIFSASDAKNTLGVINDFTLKGYQSIADIQSVIDSYAPAFKKIHDDYAKQVEAIENSIPAVKELKDKMAALGTVINKNEPLRRKYTKAEIEALKVYSLQLSKLYEETGVLNELVKLNEDRMNKENALYDNLALSMNKLITNMGLLRLGIVGVTAAFGILAGLRVASYFKEMNAEAQKLYEHTKELFSINTTGLKDAQKQITIVQTLVRNAKDENNTLENRISAIKQLNELVPGYNGQLNTTSGLYQENTKALNDYIAELKRQAIAVAAVESITKKYQTIIEKSADLQLAENLKKEMEAVQAEYDVAYRTTGISVELRERYDTLMTKSNKKIIKNIDNLKEEIAKEQQDIEYIYTTFDTNIKPAAEKAAGNAGKSAGKTFTKEFIAHLEPQETEFTNVINKLFGRESLSDVAAREAGFTATEFM